MRDLYLFVCLIFCAAACSPSYRLPAELNEVSGSIRLDDGSYWWLEDSGNPSILYQTNRKGALMQTVDLSPLQNRDWEALAANEDASVWYIGDFGNNKNKRTDLKIYTYSLEDRAVDSIEFEYPDQRFFPPKSKAQRNFNCEAMCYKNKQLHLFSKNHFQGNFYCKHYVLSAETGVQEAQLVDSIYLGKAVVTDAVYLEDTDEFALVSYWAGRKKVFPNTEGAVFILKEQNGRCQVVERIKLRKFLAIRQYETIDVLPNGDFLLSNEQRAWQRHKVRVVRRR